jgi:hypothetical protein
VNHPATIVPEDLLHFVYLDEFNDDWGALFSHDPDELSLSALEVLIMSDPAGPPVISGTGGLRKMRFGKGGEGKSGGVRVCYAYFPDHFTVLMVMAYPKGQQDNLTGKGKAGINKYLTKTKQWLNTQ